MLPLTTATLPIGSIVRIAKPIKFRDTSLNKLCKPFSVVGTVHKVTGHHPGGDVYLDNNGWSVSPLRLEKLGFALYSVTPKMTEELGGTLASLAPGERFVLSDDKQGQYNHVLTYLDREQDHPYYTDRNGVWISQLLQAGAIVKGVYEEEPQEFNSIFDAPIGMVLAYHVEGELAAGAVYTYYMRSERGVWVYNPTGAKTHLFGGWYFITNGRATRDAFPYWHDLQSVWKADAAFTEVFSYPEQAGGLDNLRNELIEDYNNS